MAEEKLNTREEAVTKENAIAKEETPENKKISMSADLNGWGICLLVIGGLHFFVPFLSPLWGIVLIILGILALAIKHRGMYIALGAGLIVVGLLNIAGSIDAGGGFWPVFGSFQIYWGIKEMIKFGKFGKEQETLTEVPALKGEPGR